MRNNNKNFFFIALYSAAMILFCYLCTHNEYDAIWTFNESLRVSKGQKMMRAQF